MALSIAQKTTCMHTGMYDLGWGGGQQQTTKLATRPLYYAAASKIKALSSLYMVMP